MKKKILLTLAFCLFLGTSKVKAETVKSYFPDENFFNCIATAQSITETTDEADFDFTSVTTLNCSDKEITDVTGLDKLTGLINLNLSVNQISTIDLTKNTELKVLDLHGNKISTIDLTKNTKLEDVNLNLNKVSTVDLTKNDKLKKLDFGGNSISTIDLTKNTDLEDVNLAGNKLSSVDLSKNTKLEKLGLGGNSISTIDLSKNEDLQELYLENNKISTIDLSKNTKLTILYLDKNPILSEVELSLNEEFNYADYLIIPENFTVTYTPAEEVVEVTDGKIVGKKEGEENATLVIKSNTDNRQETFTSKIVVKSSGKKTSDTTENPKTGVYGGSVVLIVCAFGAYMFMKNKNKYNSVR